MCREVKLLDQFKTRKDRGGRPKSYCIPCDRIVARESAARCKLRHPERVAENNRRGSKKYRLTHKEKVNEYNRRRNKIRWKEENAHMRLLRRAQQARYASRHPDRVAAQWLTWFEMPENFERYENSYYHKARTKSLDELRGRLGDQRWFTPIEENDPLSILIAKEESESTDNHAM